MSPRRESERYREILKVFEGQDRAITTKEAVESLEGKPVSIRTMQEYVALMVKSGDLDIYIEEDGVVVPVDSTVAFKRPLYATPGKVVGSSDKCSSVVVKANMHKLKRYLNKGQGGLVAEFREFIDVVKSQFPELKESLSSFREERPFVSGFVAGFIVAALIALIL